LTELPGFNVPVGFLAMGSGNNIVDALREKLARAVQRGERGLILLPGALGDSILTLPLAEYMKESAGLGGVDMVGHTEYIGIFPGRTCVDGVASIDSMGLAKLFVDKDSFDLPDGAPLISSFANYSWIVTFLGEPGGNFEQNLIFTVNCCRSAEVMTLSMKPPADYREHLTQYYAEQFVEQSGQDSPMRQCRPGLRRRLIRPTRADIQTGRKLLAELGLERARAVIVIHPGSGGAAKCWHIDNFLWLCEHLRSKGIEAVFLTGPAEQERFGGETLRRISAAGQCLMNLSLAEVVGLFSAADGYVGNDSGISHLAGAVGLKTVAVFGPTEPAVYRPVGPFVETVRCEDADFSRAPSEGVQKEVLEALLK